MELRRSKIFVLPPSAPEFIYWNPNANVMVLADN